MRKFILCIFVDRFPPFLFLFCVKVTIRCKCNYIFQKKKKNEKIGEIFSSGTDTNNFLCLHVIYVYVICVKIMKLESSRLLRALKSLYVRPNCMWFDRVKQANN